MGIGATHADFHEMISQAKGGLSSAFHVAAQFGCNEESEEAARYRLIAARARALALACEQFVAFLEASAKVPPK